MSQDDEIWCAFREATRRNNAGQLTVSTQDFVAELQQRNAPHTLRAANSWIEMHITTFSDISVGPGECRLFQMPAARDENVPQD
ncbi:DNA polymerase V subunit [Pantoea sp. GD03673]|uniref:DNA polymerase V subunit n=1 Tax=Pantoea sp. GD03673 TaxID=2975364 RepID=UPI00244C6FF5|nr:DNA polymerase V subunit [Pantoea sp. GD03673]MDH2069214.1 DNA polymerase V subunit [Pantoea sp. GD03673]